MRKLFGTDGIRGVANLDPMTSEMAMQLGRAAAQQQAGLLPDEPAEFVQVARRAIQIMRQ